MGDARSLPDMIGRRAAALPAAALRDIHPAAVELALCEAPARFYVAAPDPHAQTARRTAWACLTAARAGRAAARATLDRGAA